VVRDVEAARPRRESREKPRLGIVGPLVGGNRGYVTTIGDKWESLFRDEGYPVVAVSHARNRWVRLLDIVWTLWRARRRIDVLWVISYGGLAFVVEDIASAIGKAAGIPIVMSVHGGAMPEFMARFPKWTARVLRRASCLVAPSEYLARSLSRHGFRADVIPNVVDVSAYPYRHRSRLAPRLLWMRTFHEIWNPQMAVRVLALVRKAAPEATLVMAGGDKGLRAAVERLTEELGLAEAVRFPGFLEMDGKRREGDVAEIFLNTNRIDNQPVSVIEACAMGLPVVSTDVGGIPDLLEQEQTGLLVADGDVEGMAAAILRLLSDPALAGRLSRNGRRIAERSAVERLLPMWAEIFERLSKNARPAAGLRKVC
jgi:glycosyltransferase involved in cell wall biosynthesis